MKAKSRRAISPAGWTSGQLAKHLGISQRTIIRRCEDGTIPHTDHGTLEQARRYISPEAVRLIKIHGLRGLARMREAGVL